MGRRFLVTGGAGFIGSRLAAALVARGDEVVILDDLSVGRREDVPAGARLVCGDVRDAAAVASAFTPAPDVVCHLAALASVRLSFADPGAYLDVNVTGTWRVLAESLRAGVPRLLHASSMTIYGRPERVPVDEAAPTRPVSYYGLSKLAAEGLVTLTGGRPDLAAPLAVTSLRMFNVYGPGQRLDNPYQGVLAIFAGNLVRGEPITICAGGAQTRDFVYVDDAVAAWLAAVDAPATHGAALNLASGREVSVNEVCDAVLASAGLIREQWEVLAAPAQPGDIRRSAGDSARLRAATGWAPRVELAAGVAETVAWARRQAGHDVPTLAEPAPAR